MFGKALKVFHDEILSACDVNLFSRLPLTNCLPSLTNYTPHTRKLHIEMRKKNFEEGKKRLTGID